ncbi:non-homologous end-joining factor 1 isoform X2 [Numida meleagris]|uniref:non-homologous end-joining factor 1 isoform X2 n=1 Tax=Numida meleagris TaxID=8996 RepID=UPI000B3DE0E5|nr:non-homologous end-joining factor 1 isoform X2 [Numida meleagris]
MECSEELESRLLTQPWASVCFGESTFIAKACFGDTGYVLLISDLSGVWYESADAEAVGQRSKELNKRLTAPVSSVLQRLHGLLRPVLAGQPHAATSFSCQRPAGGLSLRVRSELSGLPFYWDFRCCPAPVATVCRHLVRPLMWMSLALQHQVQELTSMLLQKDAEIEDYRESGAALSRDRLRTEPFQENTFLQNFMTENSRRTECGNLACQQLSQGSGSLPEFGGKPQLGVNGTVNELMLAAVCWGGRAALPSTRAAAQLWLTHRTAALFQKAPALKPLAWPGSVDDISAMRKPMVSPEVSTSGTS